MLVNTMFSITEEDMDGSYDLEMESIQRPKTGHIDMHSTQDHIVQFIPLRTTLDDRLLKPYLISTHTH